MAASFWVRAWSKGNMSGRLKVEPGALTFTPGWTTRHILVAEGDLVHRKTQVWAAGRLGAFELTLRSEQQADSIVWWSIDGAHQLSWANVWAWPWQVRRLRKAIQEAGFEIVTTRQPRVMRWRPLDRGGA